MVHAVEGVAHLFFPLATGGLGLGTSCPLDGWRNNALADEWTIMFWSVAIPAAPAWPQLDNGKKRRFLELALIEVEANES